SLRNGEWHDPKCIRLTTWRSAAKPGPRVEFQSYYSRAEEGSEAALRPDPERRAGATARLRLLQRPVRRLVAPKTTRSAEKNGAGLPSAWKGAYRRSWRFQITARSAGWLPDALRSFASRTWPRSSTKNWTRR